MNKLLIDTSTQALLIVLFNDEKVIDYKMEIIVKDHSSVLIPSIDELLKKNNMNIRKIDAFYVTEGPGSYTGVRIGVTVAKIFSFILNKPLYKISTLKLICASYTSNSYIVPVIDARRGNAFSALYKTNNGRLESCIEDRLYGFMELTDKIRDITSENVLFVGIDSERFADILALDRNFRYSSAFMKDFKPEAILSLDFELVEDVHSFVPDYKRKAEAELNLK